MHEVMIRNRIRIFVFLGCLTFVVSCTNGDAGGAGGGDSGGAANVVGVDPSNPSNSKTSTLARVILLVNEQRAANGLGALTVNAQLTAAAQAFAQAMATQGFFSHTA